MVQRLTQARRRDSSFGWCFALRLEWNQVHDASRVFDGGNGADLFPGLADLGEEPYLTRHALGASRTLLGCNSIATRQFGQFTFATVNSLSSSGLPLGSL